MEHKNLVPRELEIDIQLAVMSAYVYYAATRDEHQMTEAIQQRICKARPVEDTMVPLQIVGSKFVIQRADILYVFRCPLEELVLVAGETCYEDVPVKNMQTGKAFFVDPLSRVLKTHSAQTECSVHFNLVLNVHNVWLELPHLRVIPPPKDGAVLRTKEDEEVKLLDLASGGLYTKSEVAAWEKLLSFPQYRRAELHSIALGSCLHTGGCTVSGSAATYDLTQLEAAPWLDPWDVLKETAAEYGELASLAMLGYFMLKGLINVVLISITCIQTGLSAALALFLDIYFGSTMAWKKIRARHQRIRQRQDELERHAAQQSQQLSDVGDQESSLMMSQQQLQQQQQASET